MGLGWHHYLLVSALTGGSKKTVAFAIKHKKPWLHIYRDGKRSIMSEVVRRYLQRLHQSPRRSGLLYAFPTRTIKRLDITKLETVSLDLPMELLEKLIKSESGKVQFDVEIISRDERRNNLIALYHTLRNGLARTAEAFKRETGVCFS
jgi:hypothetical protein